MKYFVAVLFCAFLATTLADVDKETIEEALGKLKHAHEDCNADPATHVDTEAVRKAHKDGAGGEVANLGAHNLCVSKKLGWQNADGSLNEAGLRAKVGEHPRADEIINECVQSQGTPEATASHLLVCFLKPIPHPNGTHAHGHQ